MRIAKYERRFLATTPILLLSKFFAAMVVWKMPAEYLLQPRLPAAFLWITLVAVYALQVLLTKDQLFLWLLGSEVRFPHALFRYLTVFIVDVEPIELANAPLLGGKGGMADPQKGIQHN